MQRIERTVTRAVIDDLEHLPAVAILGPRQAGKTTLAKSVIVSYPNALYLDLERPSHLSRLQDAEAFLAFHYDKLVCIDEVQLRPDLFPLLRALIDDDPRPGRFLILGSSSPDLLRQSSETLAGRLSHVYITPFLQRELLQAEWQPEDWRAMLWRGGFPRSFLASTDARSLRWRESYIQAFVERDLRRFGVELNPQHMRRLPPFAVNTKKRLVKSPKLYVRDSGLLTSLLELDSFEKLYGHPAYGACWEGFAVENILSMLQPQGMYGFFRTRAGEGIDLVVESQGRRLGFEFRTSSSLRLTRGNRTAAAILDLDRLFVVVPQGNAYPIEGDRVWVAPLEEIDRHL